LRRGIGVRRYNNRSDDDGDQEADAIHDSAHERTCAERRCR
jgi:hypothetical protein